MRYLDRANLLTLFGLGAALCCAFLAMCGSISIAAVLLMVSGICDLFDGMIARQLARDKDQVAFGARLDSLADVCSFGFAPAILLYAAGLTSIYEVVILLLLLFCVVWRVAYFDTVGMSGSPQGKPCYIGLPSTYVSLVIPAAFLCGLLGAMVMRAVLDAAAVALAGAMVCRFQIPKPRGLWYAVFFIMAMAIGMALLILQPVNTGSVSLPLDEV